VTSLPSGTVTFLFTDIEGSTKLAREHPEIWETARARHHAMLRGAIELNNGLVFQIIGDAFCAAFHRAGDALKAATRSQQDLQSEHWGEAVIRVRMGIHTGEAETDGKDYRGYLTMSLVQRLMSAGHGGQILLSGATENLLRGQLPNDVQLLDMGKHNFKDVPQAVRIFQVIAYGLPTEFPPLRTIDAHLNNLPTQLTSFVGREKELADVKRLLHNTHMLTLIGPGGTGKTRLSIQAASASLTQYPDGVWLVELAPILDPLLVPRTAAIAIGLRDEPQRPVIDMLCDYLTEKKMLILFDNCEHLVDICARMADRILHAAPNVRILVSSREALGIGGEVTYRVPSLGLPDLQDLPPIESFSQYEAVRLFIDRATSVVPTFAVTNENAPALAQICSRLDGIPLAIELAAAKVRVLSLDQIAKRLDDRFRLLTGGSRTALERHQTLRATIDWSFNLLPPAEQVLFRRLSVFVGGWTLEGAESVCSDESVQRDNVLNLLEQLINKSLVIAEEEQGESRYRVLETIRQYANEKLVESGASDGLRDRHLEFFLNLAETAEPYLIRSEQVEWLKRLDAEIENLRAALSWAMDKPSALYALRLAGALARFWDMRSYLLEGAKWLDRALSKDWDQTSKVEKTARAKSLYRRADLAEELDELDIMKTSAESALAICEEAEETWGIAYSCSLIACYLFRIGDSQAASPLVEQSLGMFQKLGDTWGEAFALYYRGKILRAAGTQDRYIENRQQLMTKLYSSGDRYLLADTLTFEYGKRFVLEGEWEQAEKAFQEAERLLTEIGAFEKSNYIPFYRAQLYFLCGDLERAKYEAGLSHAYCRRVGEKNTQAFVLMFLGMVTEMEDDLSGAVLYQQTYLDLMMEIGMPGYIAWGYVLLGRLRNLENKPDIAITYLQDGIEIIKKYGIRSDIGESDSASYIFTHIGGMFIKEKPQVAVHFLAFSQTLLDGSLKRRDPVFDKPYFDRFLAAARANLSEAEFTSAWEAGLKMAQEEAIELALKTVEM
jgi:predicted ATPase/class 3 adenylate cyclase